MQPLEPEPDPQDVVPRLLRRLSPEGQLPREQDVQEDAQAPHVRLGEGLSLRQDLGGCGKVKIPQKRLPKYTGGGAMVLTHSKMTLNII